MSVVKLQLTDNADLCIKVIDKEDFESIVSKKFTDERHYLAEFMEDSRYIGNDWHCLYEIGLTEAPAIGQGAIYGDESEDFYESVTDYENLWYFPDYMLCSFVEVLKEKGEVIFKRHKSN